MVDGFCVCRPGSVRTVNQDCAGWFSIDHWSLGYVADGMGGHYGGERASKIVAQACSCWWENFANAAQRPGFLQGVEQLRGLLRQCHEEIVGITPPQSVCGTTVVMLWIAGEEYALFSAGDSRCYVVERRPGFNQGPIQLTHDDVSMEPHHAGKLIRALGAGACAFSLRTGRVPHGALFALCSDGIYKAYPGFPQELRKLSSKNSLKKIADEITAQVDANGAPDNYSLVLLRKQAPMIR